MLPGVASLLALHSTIPPSHIRSFCIIAHIDHGKSTLADRFLELARNIPMLDSRGKKNEQVLDTLPVERERGITVKAQTASIIHRHKITGEPYLLNLVDTPGHVDFAYEVSRSLAACQGALLLVDCSQGVQAQTVANHGAARDAGLQLIPIINKIDLPTCDPEPILEQVVRYCGRISRYDQSPMGSLVD